MKSKKTVETIHLNYIRKELKLLNDIEDSILANDFESVGELKKKQSILYAETAQQLKMLEDETSQKLELLKSKRYNTLLYKLMPQLLLDKLKEFREWDVWAVDNDLNTINLFSTKSYEEYIAQSIASSAV